MSISALVLNGSIQHQQNLSSLKHNSDNKGKVDQSKISAYLNRNTQNKMDTVEISKEAFMKQQQDGKDNGKKEEKTKKASSNRTQSVRRGVSYEIEYTPQKMVVLKMPISRPMTGCDYRI